MQCRFGTTLDLVQSLALASFRWGLGLLFLMSLIYPLPTSAQSKYVINYQGRILDDSGKPLVSSKVNFLFSIFVRALDNQQCLLYSETVSGVDMSTGAGEFSVNIGSGLRTDASPIPLQDLFNPYLVVESSSQCQPGYIKKPGDKMYLQVAFDDGTGYQGIDPLEIAATPYSMETINVAGVPSGNVLRVDSPAGQTLFTTQKFNDLLSLIEGTSTKYVRNTGGGGALLEGDIPTLVSAGKVVGSAITSGTIGGTTAINTTGNLTTSGYVSANALSARQLSLANAGGSQVTLVATGSFSNYQLALPVSSGSVGQVLTSDGSGNLIWGNGASSNFVSSLTAGTGLLGGTITSAGTLTVDVGTTANKIVQLNSSAQLPAVSGVNLTNLNASNLTTGTIPLALLPASATAWLDGGAGKLYYNGGNVGIGTTAPNAQLQVSATNTATSGTNFHVQLTPTYNQTSGSAANTDLLINRTQTAVGSGTQRLIDAQVGGASKFSVDNLGNVIAAGTITAASITGSSTSSNNLAGGATGSIPYQSSPGNTTMLAIGGSGSLLTSTGSGPQWTTTLPVANGGTGTTSLTGILLGNGTGAITSATAGTHYSVPSGIENFTGAKTFDYNKLLIKGNSGGGVTTLNSTNTTATNYSLTFPAIDDTVVTFTSSGTLTNKTIDTASGKILKLNGNTLTASVGTGTLTLPNSTDTLIGRNTTDTLTNKTWSGVAIGTTYGGTGLTSYATGDLLYASSANTLSKLSVGSTGQVLTISSGTVPSWTTPTGTTQWVTSGTNISYSAGNVGIGTTAPYFRLTNSSQSNITDQTPTGLAGANSLVWEHPSTDTATGYVAAIANSYNSSAALGLLVKTTDTTANNKILTLNSGGNDRVTVLGNGKVGIGTAAPTATLDVNGQARTRSFSQTTGAIDFSKSNVIITSFDCSSTLSFSNLLDGASYTLVITDAGTTQCNFNGTTTGDDAGTLTFRFIPANGTRIPSTHSIYTMQRAGTNVYVSWISGY